MGSGRSNGKGDNGSSIHACDDDDDDGGEVRRQDHGHCVELVRTRDYEGYCKLMLP